MIDLSTMATNPQAQSPVESQIGKTEDLTARQREVATLVSRYVQGAGEMPSAGWLARRLRVSRQTAREHLQTLRRKQWFGPYRDRS